MDIVDQAGSRVRQQSGAARGGSVLAVLLSAVAMDMIDTSVVNVAVPAVQRSFHCGYAAIEWIVAGYTLAFAVALVTGGRLGDLYGRRRVFQAGVALFMVASASCGLAQSAGMLVGSRVAQGLGAALMIPQVLSTIQVTFNGKERSAALGAYGAVVGLATISGPLFGGLLLRVNLFGLTWRPIFLINVLVGLLVIPAAAAVLPESRAADPGRTDLRGVALLTVALVAVFYPLVEGQQRGWPLWLLGILALSVPLLGAFFAWERRLARVGGSPVVPPTLFSRPGFSVGSAATLVFMSGVGSFFLITTLFLQLGGGFTALRAGLTTVAASVGLAVAATGAGRLPDRTRRLLLVPGSLLAAAGTLLMFAVTDAATPPTPWRYAVPLFVYGFGMGLVAPTVVDAVLSTVPDADAGAASGVVNTNLQLGSALGVALVGFVFFSTLTSHAPASAEQALTRATRASQAVSVGAPDHERFRRCFTETADVAHTVRMHRECAQALATPDVAPLARYAIADDFAVSLRKAMVVLGGLLTAAALLMIPVARTRPRDGNRTRTT